MAHHLIPSDTTIQASKREDPTMLHERGWPSDVIERQLSHSERNAVKAAYTMPSTCRHAGR